MAFDILARKPKTVEEALNAIEWYECCKSTQRKRNQVRLVTTRDDETADPQKDDDAGIRRFGGKKFVTDERLYQFGNELKNELTKELKREIVSAVTEVVQKRPMDRSFSPKPKPDWKYTPSRERSSDGIRRGPVKCYNCQEEGHYSRECPKKSSVIREISEREEWDPETEDDMVEDPEYEESEN